MNAFYADLEVANAEIDAAAVAIKSLAGGTLPLSFLYGFPAACRFAYVL